MNHTEAIRLQAAEKYLLGELPKTQLEEYEEHYFDCSACAEELKATVAFMESSRQVVREPVPQRADVKGVTSTPGGWFTWLRPAFAVPVFAALLLAVIGYQNGVTIPKLKNSSSSQMAQIISSSFQLKGNVRGGSDASEASNKVRVRSGESFTLNFDFTPTDTFSEYDWQLLDQAGRVVGAGQISGEKKYQTVSLPLNGGVNTPGKYALVFHGADGSTQTPNQAEAQRLTFTVEFL